MLRDNHVHGYNALKNWVLKLVGLPFICKLVWFPLIHDDVRGQTKFLDSNGVQIAYTDQGAGDPVVLIHGLSSNGRMTWEVGGIGVISALSEKFRVLAIDLRGHGASEKPHHPLDYGLDTVKDIIRLLNHLGISRSHIAGYSYGGGIALKLVATYPDRVKSVIIGGAGWTPRPAGNFSLYEAWADGFDRGTVGPMLTSTVQEGEDPPSPERIARIDAAFSASNDLKALAALLRATRELVVAEGTLRANQVPTLAIIGERDFNKDAVDALKGVMSNLKVVVIKEATHVSALMDPSFLPSIVSFFSEHSN
ncbi:alpha/beta hydrolase [bacterium]|nr:alpha/beta hydrolase [bacterium]